ncbi:hypothetical protein C8Q77DRAFT_1147635 [Trametes polyzona]|nr:hypothetical protein C8Q77DRAFT_1147635 [Trametes polyzona]
MDVSSSAVCAPADGTIVPIQLNSLTRAASSITNAKFNFDTSGVAGFFGADVAVSAMATVHVFEGRRWLGWYNQPGSYEVAKLYGRLASSPFWDALYPGPNDGPAAVLHFEGAEQGPRYTFVGAESLITDGTTGYAAHLFMKRFKTFERCQHVWNGRSTAHGTVTIVKLKANAVLNDHSFSTQIAQRPCMWIVEILCISASITTAVLCAFLKDWYCCSMILFGMACNGIAWLVLGRASLHFQRNKQQPRKDDGMGFLDRGNDIVILQGPRVALSAITKGQFALDYSGRPEHHDLGVCSVLLSLQILAQLLVVPQGHLFGQLLFLASLAVSWAHNSYLSSPDLACLLQDLLFERVLGLDMLPTLVRVARDDEEKQTIQPEEQAVVQYSFGTRTATVVFTLLTLAAGMKDEDDSRYAQLLDQLLPNHSKDWKQWKREVLKSIRDSHCLLHCSDSGSTSSLLPDGGWQFRFRPSRPSPNRTPSKRG